ncbi:hypothetical protein H2201_005726 [Coniosporium apollinis]|uniref:Uncharacterized protein n=1 Tax=Coniosporium apollinis TaxID=61459 RepID=A0ABQ9NR73_9PEZI|nr:hypothetical protein H2201_005726 [Coniosporium apollinis]
MTEEPMTFVPDEVKEILGQRWYIDLASLVALDKLPVCKPDTEPGVYLGIGVPRVEKRLPCREWLTPLLGISSRLDLFKRDFKDLKELIQREFAELRKHAAKPTKTPPISPHTVHHTTAPMEGPRGTTPDTDIRPTTENEGLDLHAPTDQKGFQSSGLESNFDHANGHLVTGDDTLLDSLFEPLH